MADENPRIGLQIVQSVLDVYRITLESIREAIKDVIFNTTFEERVETMKKVAINQAKNVPYIYFRVRTDQIKNKIIEETRKKINERGGER